MTSNILRTSRHYLSQGAHLCSTLATPSLTPLYKQLEKIEKATQSIGIPPSWQPEPAHVGPVNPSISMLVWASVGNRTAHKQSNHSSVLIDKVRLIESLFRLQQEGIVSLSNDISVISEGCDTGNYLPLLFSALTCDGKDRVIRPFLINGSSGMVNTASRVAYRLLQMKGDSKVYGGVCNAFDRPPSELSQFATSQKLFMPFRMGIVGSYKEIESYLKARMPLIGQSGLCCLSLLADTTASRDTLEKEHNHNLEVRESDYYTEFFRPLSSKMVRLLTKDLSNRMHTQLMNSMGDNPQYKQLPTYACATVFQERGINSLIERIGGKVLETDILKSAIRSTTDRKNEIDIRAIVITSK